MASSTIGSSREAQWGATGGQMQERSPFILQGRQKDAAGEMVTACPVASPLRGGHRGGEGPSSASPRPGVEEDGEAMRLEPLLPKPPVPSFALGIQRPAATCSHGDGRASA